MFFFLFLSVHLRFHFFFCLPLCFRSFCFFLAFSLFFRVILFRALFFGWGFDMRLPILVLGYGLVAEMR